MSLSRLSTVLVLAGMALAVYALARGARRTDHAEDLLDAAVEETFPASDPIAVSSAYRRASRKT